VTGTRPDAARGRPGGAGGAGRGRGRLARVLAAATVVVSLAGCVSMQNSGPPGTIAASPSGTTQNAANIAPIPAPPGPGLSPEQLVSAFLSVSASYSTYPNIVKSYLTPQKALDWNPQWSATVFSSFPDVKVLNPPKRLATAKRVVITVQGQVQATFSGSGQYLSVAQSLTPSSCAKDQPSFTCEQFTVTQSAGQWRIAELPSYLLIDEYDFSRVYQPQDLYFFGAGASQSTGAGQGAGTSPLVPDTVFVPDGTSAQQQLTTLVNSLIAPSVPSAGGSVSAGQTWLTGNAARTSFPPGTKLLSPVTTSAGTATVNLGGAIAQPSERKLIALVMAQLTWTLTGLGGPITAVDLEINGNPWSATPQTRKPYQGYSPYPAEQGVFTYLDDGVALSRCGSSSANISGAGVPVFGTNGEPALASCAGASASPSPSATSLPGQPGSGQPGSGKPGSGKTHSTPGTGATYPLSTVLASPDSQYLAGVSAAGNQVYIWDLATHTAVPVKWGEAGQSINSISWDRQDDLWIVTHDGSTQNNSVYMVPAGGKAAPATFEGQGNVLSLSVAPDGVRVALIVATASGNQQVELAGIDRVVCQANCRLPGSLTVLLTQGPTLGSPSITNATSLTWYNQDNLYVLDKTGAASALYEVPVSGQSPGSPDQVSLASASDSVSSSGVSVYPESITADNGDSADNVLVAAMSNAQLLISAAASGPWVALGAGSAPAYGANP